MIKLVFFILLSNCDVLNMEIDLFVRWEIIDVMNVGWVVSFIVKFVFVKLVSRMLFIVWSFCLVLIVIIMSVFRRIIRGYVIKSMMIVSILKKLFIKV